ncbi:MAG: FAD-dependent oxidoreductase [Actinomycetota bacterium]|nr:FAD-dependent oxidoreductase [Actinomycetota bacterium]
MTFASSTSEPFHVLIVGGGVAALEAALALRELGGERIATTLIAPNPEFMYRPMTVREPFGYAPAKRYPLRTIVRDIGVELLADRFKWLDPERRVVHTEAGDQPSYDALLLALGARMHSRFKHAITLDDTRLDELLHGLIQDIEGGYVKRLAFIVPGRMGWPLPIYELALMTASRAFDMNVELSITIATPEDAPLAIFGRGVSDAVGQLLEENGIVTITSAHCEVHEPGRVAINPGSRELQVDRIVAMPELHGPSVPGVPGGSPGGFIPVDIHCKVPGIERVWAAGDATDFAIKHGGIAAQQADVAAQAIAALAGLAEGPQSFRPDIHGILLTGGKPLYLSAHITGGHGSSSQITEKPTWAPATKIAAKYLAPYLEEHDSAAGSGR